MLNAWIYQIVVVSLRQFFEIEETSDSLAQLVELSAFNRKVAGPSPAGVTKHLLLILVGWRNWLAASPQMGRLVPFNSDARSGFRQMQCSNPALTAKKILQNACIFKKCLYLCISSLKFFIFVIFK